MPKRLHNGILKPSRIKLLLRTEGPAKTPTMRHAPLDQTSIRARSLMKTATLSLRGRRAALSCFQADFRLCGFTGTLRFSTSALELLVINSARAASDRAVGSVCGPAPRWPIAVSSAPTAAGGSAVTLPLVARHYTPLHQQEAQQPIVSVLMALSMRGSDRIARASFDPRRTSITPRPERPAPSAAFLRTTSAG